jgi:hypothetical protein
MPEPDVQDLTPTSQGDGDIPFADPKAIAGTIRDFAAPRNPQSLNNEMPITPYYQPYMFTQGRKHHSEWDKPTYILEGARRYPGIAPGPWMPQIEDVRHVNRTNANFFMRNGSILTQLLAGKLLYHNDRYWENYVKGRHAAAIEHLEEYKLAQEQLTVNNKKLFTELSTAWAAYGKDPNKLRSEVERISQEFNFPRLREVMQEQGMKRVEEFISEIKNNDEDQLKIINQRLAAEKVRAEVDEAKDTALKTQEILNPNAPTEAQTNYNRTGEPSLDRDELAIDPVPGEGAVPPTTVGTATVPKTTPATHADIESTGQHPSPQREPLPVGITPENAKSRRGELIDYADRNNLPRPPPDTAGLTNWVNTYSTPGDMGPLNPAQPATATKPLPPNQVDTPQPLYTPTGELVSPAARRIAPIIGMNAAELDRDAWDLFAYNRIPHELTAPPKGMQGWASNRKTAITTVAFGPGGIEEQIRRITNAVPPAKPGQTERESIDQGDKVLDQLMKINPEAARQVRAILHGRQKMPPAGFGATARGPQAIRDLVYAVDPDYDSETRYEGRRRTIQAFTGSGQFSQRILAFKTAVNHMTTLKELMDAIPNSTSMDLNHLKDAIESRFGATAWRNFREASQFVGTEVARSFRGSQTTLKEIEDIKGALSASQSPAQMSDSILVLSHLMKGQLDALADEYNRNTFSNKTGADLFNDRRYIDRFNKILNMPSKSGLPHEELTRYESMGSIAADSYNSDLPDEAIALKQWLTQNPNDPLAADVRHRIDMMGWSDQTRATYTGPLKAIK